MSQSAAVRAVRPSARPTARIGSPRPVARTTQLRVVGAPTAARSRAILMMGCLVLLGFGLMGLLVLNVSLEKGAFELRHQQEKTNWLMAQQQVLQEQLASLEAPQTLESRARQLGMVSAPNVAFVRTSDGQVLGVPEPGVVVAPPKTAIGAAVTATAAAGPTVAATSATASSDVTPAPRSALRQTSKPTP